MQRMCALLDYLNCTGNFEAFLVTWSEPPLKNQELEKFLMKDLPSEAGLIIRDMRDSGTEEIDRLKKIAPVVVIDDRGPGRERADIAIDLLPHPAHRIDRDSYHPQCFIYGYEFTRSIRILGDMEISRDIPVSIYAGYSPEKDHVRRLLRMVPPEMPAVLLTGSEPLSVKNGSITGRIDRSCAEIIASSRVVLSHFGITLYEGFISGARLIALNPSEYHNELTLCAADMDIVSGGLLEKADTESIRETIRDMADNPLSEKVRASKILGRIMNNLDNFASFLEGFARKKS